MTWQPHITVATVIEDSGRFLFVEELKSGGLVLNQPAGHLEPNETLLDAAIRETLEETAWHVELIGVVGIYLYTAPSNGVTYQRICFAARPTRFDPQRTLDNDITATHWLTQAQLLEQGPQRWRSELVPRCLADYLTTPLHSLDLIRI